MVLLPVTIGKQGTFQFVLDTGASSSVIDRPIADRLHLKQAGTPQAIAGIAGNEQEIPVHISSWHVESIHLPPSIIGSANLFTTQRNSGVQGLLGSDIWRQFGDVTINYSAGTITVPKQIASTSAAPLGLVAEERAWRRPVPA